MSSGEDERNRLNEQTEVSEMGTSRDLGLKKEGIKVSAVFLNMAVIGIGFLQFGK